MLSMEIWQYMKSVFWSTHTHGSKFSVFLLYKIFHKLAFMPEQPFLFFKSACHYHFLCWNQLHLPHTSCKKGNTEEKTYHVFSLNIFFALKIEGNKMAGQTSIKHFILWVQNQENKIKSEITKTQVYKQWKEKDNCSSRDRNGRLRAKEWW